jgi:hypothetical protein
LGKDDKPANDRKKRDDREQADLQKDFKALRV